MSSHSRYHNLSFDGVEIEEAITLSSFKKEEDIVPDRDLEVGALKKEAVIVFFLMVAVAGGAAALFLKSDFYRARAEANITRIVSVPSVRGIVYDRYGAPLLENVPAFRLSVAPAELGHNERERAEAIATLADIMGMEMSDIVTRIQEGAQRYENEILITRTISQEQAVRLKALDIPGIRIVDEVRRHYGGGKAFSHILGYVGAVDEGDREMFEGLHLTDLIGKDGIERYYDHLLRGENGERLLVRNMENRGFEDRGMTSPVPGNSLELTIDGELQEYFYNRFEQGLRAIGRERGAGIAMDPNTGEILAMVSFPSYDGNWFSRPHQYSDEIRAALNDSGQPFFNRAVSGLYNPGSTIKPLMALGALEENIISPQRSFDAPGHLLVPNPYNPQSPSVFLDWKEHGRVDMRRAIAVSANVYFYIVGGGTDYQEGLGISRIISYLQKFHLHESLGLDIGGSRASRIPKWDDPERQQPWRLGDTYNVSIGQGELQTTLVHLVSYTATLANGGTVYRPSLVKNIKNEHNEVIRRYSPEILSDAIARPENIAVVVEGMRDVVRRPYGTGYFMNDLPFPVAGKSGTAQVASTRTINSLFIAFAPADDPRIAIAVIIENAREEGLNAVPIVKDTLMWYYTNRIEKES